MYCGNGNPRPRYLCAYCLPHTHTLALRIRTLELHRFAASHCGALFSTLVGNDQ
jgi:hypothetical protein